MGNWSDCPQCEARGLACSAEHNKPCIWCGQPTNQLITCLCNDCWAIDICIRALPRDRVAYVFGQLRKSVMREHGIDVGV